MRTILGLLAAFAISACTPSPADAFRASEPDLRRGRALFTGTCAGYCHNPTSERDAPLLFDCASIHGNDDQAMFDVITRGVPDTRMMGFGGKLPEGDDDIWRLVAYISSERPAC